MFNHVLLASHGTTGAKAAENMAISTCTKGGSLTHLFVVPEFWQGMTGDDWLNNGSTRDQFRQYLETELGKEVDEHCARVSRAAKQQELHYNKAITLGEPEKVLIQYSKTQNFDLIIMGSPRPKSVEGLRSKMLTKNLTHCLPIPLLIAPYPR